VRVYVLTKEWWTENGDSVMGVFGSWEAAKAWVNVTFPDVAKEPWYTAMGVTFKSYPTHQYDFNITEHEVQ